MAYRQRVLSLNNDRQRRRGGWEELDVFAAINGAHGDAGSLSTSTSMAGIGTPRCMRCAGDENNKDVRYGQAPA